jgi:methyl-accepting chemotaxis protein
VAAVGRIERTITEMNAIAGSIAAAVEQQGAATAEIARNVTETASAANEMTARTTEVSGEALDTGRRAADVRQNVGGLNEAIEELRHSVIRVVRTSTVEVDRRGSQRHDVDLPCRLRVGGQVHRGRVTDLSDTGAQVRDAPALSAGVVGALEIDGVAMRLPFVVKAQEDGQARLEFTLDVAAAAEFRGTAERLTQKRAA